MNHSLPRWLKRSTAAGLMLQLTLVTPVVAAIELSTDQTIFRLVGLSAPEAALVTVVSTTVTAAGVVYIPDGALDGVDYPATADPAIPPIVFGGTAAERAPLMEVIYPDGATDEKT